MEYIETVDISDIKFTSTVFPTLDDMALWEGLSPEQKKAVKLREVKEGQASGLAAPCTMADIIAEAKAKMKK